jgi:hypothetical protein
MLIMVGLNWFEELRNSACVFLIFLGEKQEQETVSVRSGQRDKGDDTLYIKGLPRGKCCILHGDRDPLIDTLKGLTG